MESGLHITLAAERLFTVWGFPITNTLLTAWVVMAILLVLGFIVRKNLALIPGKLQNAVEMFFEYLLGLMEQTLGERRLAVRYFPLIATIFLFILFANFFDFIPVFGTLGFTEGGEFVPLFHPVNADLNTTLALAIISFFVIEISGIVSLGLLKYGSKFVNFTSGVMGFIVGLIEIIGNLARLISLSFRLFGAIFAGEVLLLVVGTFVPLLLPVPLMAFEAFIGLLQAAIFAILTLAFIKLAISEHAH
ncbi:MAG: F0F1 ATP synthase subunit A [Patescibacteria group bacterium]